LEAQLSIKFKADIWNEWLVGFSPKLPDITSHIKMK